MAAPASPSPLQRPTQAAAPKRYPFWLGGAAASVAACCTHPLDLTKVRMQTGGQRGMFGTLVATARHDGFRGLYVGLSASILRQMTYSVTRFGAYEPLKRAIRSPNDPATLPAWKMAICAGAAGAAGGLAGNPADVILVRMTSDINKTPESRLGYRNCFDGLFRMLREEGFVSLFRGLAPNVARAILMNSSQLATYDYFKAFLLGTGLYREGTWLHFNASLLAGTVATTICSPADVIRSRIMNATEGLSIVQMIQKSMREEGPGFMFKGWTPAWIRLAPNTIIIFLVLEKLRGLVDLAREKFGRR